jgi:phage tail sheath protein FI
VTAGNGVPSYYVAADEVTNVKKRKFVMGMQGGFDGQWPAVPINVGSDIIAGNTQGLNCTSITSAGSIGYKQCIAALGNADEFDINLIATPGIFSSLHSYVVNLVIDMCEARGDCFYIMDNVVFPASNQSTGLIDAAVAQAEMFDSNYVGTYYPWVKILDTNLNRIVSVPPSVVLPAVFAANDNSAAEWFAPAGLNRGGITQAVQVLDRLTHQERDTLYEGRVNPIAAFPGQGISVWGQKTLQVAPSALDRINVRRLLIALKKFIASSSKFLVFEQNVAVTRNKFLAIVNPYLESVQQRSGLYAFQVVMDESNNTPDLLDRNVLYGQIYLQPAKTAEFIILDFNILPSGALFPGA